VKLTVWDIDITKPDENDVHLKGEEVKWAAHFSPSTISPDIATWNFSYTQGSGIPSSGSGQTEGNERIFYSTLTSGGVTLAETVKIEVEVTIDSVVVTDERTIKSVIPNVTKVSFNQDHQLWDNISEEIIEDPVWEKGLSESVSKDSEVAYSMPVYSGGVLVETSVAYAEIEIEGCLSLTNSTSVQVKGTGDENFFPQGAWFHTWDWSGSGIQLTSSPLRGSVGKYNKMDVSWKYRVKKKSDDDCGDWVDMNSSSHLVYVVYDTPKSPMSVPWTEVLDYSCVWADGEMTASGVFTAITTGAYNNSGKDYYGWDSHTSGEIFNLTDFFSDTGADC